MDTKGFYAVEEGILTTVKVAAPASAIESAHHTVPHIALGAWGSESAAFSPDGRFFVTLNLRGTGKAPGDPALTTDASVSLYEIDRKTGRLTNRGEWLFPAILPQGLAFDASGRNLYIGVNRYPDQPERASQGAVEVWRLIADATPRLERTNERVHLPPEVHTIVAH